MVAQQIESNMCYEKHFVIRHILPRLFMTSHLYGLLSSYSSIAKQSVRLRRTWGRRGKNLGVLGILGWH